jgi:hypothetical protein
VGRGGWPADEIIGQIYVTRGRPGAEGHVHFRMGSLMPGGERMEIGGADTLPPMRVEAIRAARMRSQARRDSMTAKLKRETYARAALVPRMPWLDDVAPPRPLVERVSGTSIRLAPGRGEPVFLWVVQSRWREGWRTEVLPSAVREWVLGSTLGLQETPDLIWVSAVDRMSNQSPPVRVP